MAVGREIVRRHRALDYLPPVDVTFLEYLRALITADFDLVGDDRYNYRVAFVEAFSRRGGRRRRSRAFGHRDVRRTNVASSRSQPSAPTHR